MATMPVRNPRTTKEEDAYTPYRKEQYLYADYEDEAAFPQADVPKPQSDVADS